MQTIYSVQGNAFCVLLWSWSLWWRAHNPPPHRRCEGSMRTSAALCPPRRRAFPSINDSSLAHAASKQTSRDSLATIFARALMLLVPLNTIN